MMVDLYTNDRIIGMRTNIDIDDALLSQAMAAAGLSTKRATVEEGLRLLVRLREQAKALAELKGIGWEGDLDQIRQGRPPRRS
jgi:Arc/MetJ family transcription regulator